MTNTPPDHAAITLTDHRNRTVCRFIKEKPDSGWSVADKPVSRKRLALNVQLVREGEELPPVGKGDLAPAHLKRLPDGRHSFTAPGLTLRWEKLAPILDRLAAHDIRRLTVAQLRSCISGW